MKTTYYSPFAVIRTPLLPYENLLKILDAKDVDNALIEAYQNPIVLEALFYASKDLYYALSKYLDAPDSFTKRKKEKLFRALFSYYIRMCYRCTPFGLFAGVSLSKVSNDETILNLKSYESSERHFRFDMEFFLDIVRAYLNDKMLLEQLKFLPNNTLFSKKNSLSYFEPKHSHVNEKHSQTQRLFSSVNISNHSVNQTLLEAARHGALFSDLVELLLTLEYDIDESKKYIHELIESKVLISEIEPTVSDSQYFEKVVKRLNAVDSSKYSLLSTILKLIQEFNSYPNRVSDYRKFESLVTKHLTSNKLKNYLQVDLFRPGINVNVNEDIINDIVSAVAVMNVMNNTDFNNSYINRFKRSFEQHYEHAIVPIMNVFDEEIGIGYNRITSDKDHYQNSNTIFQYNEITEYKFGLFKKYLQEKNEVIDITDIELSKFKKKQNLPNSFASFISIFNNPNGNVGKIIHLQYAISSPIKTIGRFSYNKELFNKVKAFIKQEENIDTEKIYAEIVYLPSDRIGNIVSRPSLRSYEIPIVCPSTLQDDHVILLSDLYLSVRNKRFILWSKKHQKEIVPRLSVAHNHYSYFGNSKNLPVYQFLCDLQYADDNFITAWNWEFLSTEKFLPRIIYKDIILSLKKWNFPAYEITGVVFENNQHKSDYFQSLIRKYKLPKTVIFSIDDNHIVLDLSSEICQDIIIQKSKNRRRVVLQENLIDDNLSTSSSDGYYTNEIILPIINNIPSSPKHNLTSNYNVTENIIKIKFEPGSEWIYCKIYINKLFTDKLLQELFVNVISPLQKDRIIKKWFFIKYSDPQYHIRLRVYTEDIKYYNVIIAKLNDTLTQHVENGKIFRIINDTYIREAHRYGVANMDLSESFFHRDSELAIRLIMYLRATKQDDHAKYRFFICLRCIDSIFDCFGYTVENKIAIWDKANERFLQNTRAEFIINIKNFIKDNYYNDEKFLRGILKTNSNEEDNLWESYIDQYKLELNNIAPQIEAALREEILSKDDIVTTYVHLFVNRLIIHGTLFWEPLTYFYLHKVYTSSFSNIDKVYKMVESQVEHHTNNQTETKG